MMKKRTESTQVSQLRFLGGQDGVPERELKERLIEYFRHSRSVEAAYLAQVTYGGSAVSVALCLTPSGGHDSDVVQHAGRIFASMFGPPRAHGYCFCRSESGIEACRCLCSVLRSQDQIVPNRRTPTTRPALAELRFALRSDFVRPARVRCVAVPGRRSPTPALRTTEPLTPLRQRPPTSAAIQPAAHSLSSTP